MRARPIISFVLLLVAYGVGQSVFAAEKAKSPAYKAYEEQCGLIANQAIERELEKRPERLSKISLNLKFQVDHLGRVHNIALISGRQNHWAEEGARHALNGLKLPPPPKTVAEEAGAGWVTVESDLVVDLKPPKSRPPSHSTADQLLSGPGQATYAYQFRTHEIICYALDAEFLKRSRRSSTDLTLTVAIDSQGHLRVVDVHCTPANRSVQETATRIIASVKLPSMPREVIAEVGHNGIRFQGEWSFRSPN
jgi:hypothetical protein